MHAQQSAPQEVFLPQLEEFSSNLAKRKRDAIGILEMLTALIGKLIGEGSTGSCEQSAPPLPCGLLGELNDTAFYIETAQKDSFEALARLQKLI